MTIVDVQFTPEYRISSLHCECGGQFSLPSFPMDVMTCTCGKRYALDCKQFQLTGAAGKSEVSHD